MIYNNIKYEFDNNKECFMVYFESKQIRCDSIKECKKEIDNHYSSIVLDVINYIYKNSFEKKLDLGDYNLVFLDNVFIEGFTKLYIVNILDVEIINSAGGIGGDIIFKTNSNEQINQKCNGGNIYQYFRNNCIIIKKSNNSINDLKTSLEKRNIEIDKLIEKINQVKLEGEAQVNKFFDLNSIVDTELYSHIKGKTNET